MSAQHALRRNGKKNGKLGKDQRHGAIENRGMTNVETPIMPTSHESHARADGKQPPPARLAIPMTARPISLFADPCRCREAAPRGLARWRLMRVLDYIDANFQRPVSLDELSQVAGLSRIRFGAQFRQTMGATPYAFILQRRIAYSQHLLRESVIPLAEIALMAGFSSQAHFTTIFSRMTGMPPGQWRRVASS